MVIRRSALLTTVLEDTITVSSAEILALFATPKELISAPGMNKYLIVDYVEAFNDFGTTAYAANAAGIDVLYSGGSTIANLTETWAEATGDQLASAITVAVDDVPANTAVDLQALAADPTTGDGDWLIHIGYRIVALP